MSVTASYIFFLRTSHAAWNFENVSKFP